MALDEDFVRDIAFRLRRGESVVIEPDAAMWQAFLQQQLRRAQAWGAIGWLLATLAIVLLFGISSPGLILLSLLALCFLYWWRRLVYRTHHLLPHGLYRYELRPESIARHHGGTPDIFAYRQLDNMVKERYGLRLERQVSWYEWLWPRILQSPGQRLLILPGYFSGYDSYLDFLDQDENRAADNL
jgi:hypothetical protein